MKQLVVALVLGVVTTEVVQAAGDTKYDAVVSAAVLTIINTCLGCSLGLNLPQGA